VWLCALAAAQAPTFVSFDAPDAGLAEGLGTHPARINRNGVIAGWYLDSHVLMHGFVRTANGQITEFDAAGAKGTHPDDINSFGQIVGETSSQGFLRMANGVFIKIAFPGSINTFARGINDSGAITGAYSDSANQWHGFVRDPGGAYTSFDAPDASGQSSGTTPTAINASGEIAGYYEDSSFVFHGFVRDPSGNITEFDTPGGTVSDNAWPSINAGGSVIGGYTDVHFVTHGFLRDAAVNITTIDKPGATLTFANGINDRGAVAGGAVVAQVFGGFRRDASGKFFKISAPPPNHVTTPTSLNLKNITGWYYDVNGGIHGFVQ
jgi:uncharacterized membrane protein